MYNAMYMYGRRLSQSVLYPLVFPEKFLLDVIIKFIFTAESLFHDISDVITDVTALDCVLVDFR